MPSPSEAAEDVALAKALSQSASEHAAAAAVRVAVLSFSCPIVFSFPGGRIQSDRLGVRLPTNGRVFVWGFRQIWMGQHKMYLWLMAVRSLTVPTTGCPLCHHCSFFASKRQDHSPQKSLTQKTPDPFGHGQRAEGKASKAGQGAGHSGKDRQGDRPEDEPEDEPEDGPEDGPGDAPFDHASLDASAPPRDEDPESRRPRRDRAVLSRPAGLAHPGELSQHCQAHGKGH